MKGNDLDNRPVPKDLLVWEGLLGLIPDHQVARAEAKFRAKKKWAQAVACYEVHEMLARRIWHMVWNYGLDVELITYHGQDFAEELEKRMDRENMPFRHVWSEEPNILARRLATMVDVRHVYDPFPDHAFLYGGKGRPLQPETAHHLFGAL